MPRTEIEPHKGDKRSVRRDEKGLFTKNQVDEGKSLTADRRQHAEAVVKHGEGDRGDEKR
jgi:hypothetical protein